MRRAGVIPAPHATERTPVRALLPLRRPILRLRGALGRWLSVRWKLTLWYGLMCLLVLGIAGLSQRAAMHRQVASSIDSSLRDTAHTLDASLSRTIVAPGSQAPIPSQCRKVFPAAPGVQQYCAQMQQALTINSQEISQPGQFEQIHIFYTPSAASADAQNLAGDATVHPESQRCSVIYPFRDIYMVPLVAATGKARFYDVLACHRDLREFLIPLHPPGPLRAQGVTAVLEVFQNRQNFNAIERTFDLIQLLTIPLGFLIALVAGWWIARAALRPIERISRTVQSIGESKDLSRRLNFIGPSDEVGRLAETFDAMMERLDRAFETQKRFIADASHELRTPLTAIRGNADLMSMAPPEEKNLCLTAIRREAERMSRLVSDLLLLAEADVDTQPLQTSTLDLDDLILEVHQSALVLADGKVSVVLDTVDPVRIQADGDRIKQLLLNLLDNAVKFTPQGGTVTLALRRDTNGALIEVADSGVGISPEDQLSIFERFYRVEEARSTRGSGLGLAICAWIVKAHHGTIEVRSQLGKGSTFSVRLPASAVGSQDTAPATVTLNAPA